jgi:hypothetical protein
MAIRKFCTSDRSVGHTRRDNELPLTAEVRTSEANAKTDERGPPTTSDRGS